MNLYNISACILCLSVASCATVVRGTTEDVVIKTSPNDARVVTSFNHVCQTNPCTVKVPRKESFQVTASKKGYRTQTVSVGTKVSGRGAAGLAGNIVAGGIIGVGVDAATGAGRDHYPNPVIIDLVPTGSGAVSGNSSSATPPAPAGKKGIPTS